MKEDRISQEKFNLVNKELATLTDKLDEMGAVLKEIEDLKTEVKGLKLFIGRVHPELKSQLPAIIKKINKKR